VPRAHAPAQEPEQKIASLIPDNDGMSDALEQALLIQLLPRSSVAAA